MAQSTLVKSRDFSQLLSGNRAAIGVQTLGVPGFALAYGCVAFVAAVVELGAVVRPTGRIREC